jgi:hypothetical protein
MTSFRGLDIWAKMMPPGGKPIAQACHQTIKVNKTEELTYLAINIERYIHSQSSQLNV